MAGYKTSLFLTIIELFYFIMRVKSYDSEYTDEEDPYEDDVFAGRGQMAGKLTKTEQKFVQPGVPVHPNTDARVVFKIRDEDPQMISALRKEFRTCPEVQISCGTVLSEERWDAVMMPMTNSFGWTDVEPVSRYVEY